MDDEQFEYEFPGLVMPPPMDSPLWPWYFAQRIAPPPWRGVMALGLPAL